MVACSRSRDVSVMKCVCLFRGEGKKTERYLLVFRLKCMEAVETVVTIICRKCSFLRPYEWVHFTRGRELLVYKFVCILFGPFFVSYLLIRNFMEVNEPVLLSLSAFSFFSFLFLCCLILHSGLQMYLSREKTQNCHCLKLHFLPSGELKRSCLMSDLQDCWIEKSFELLKGADLWVSGFTLMQRYTK